MSSMGAYSIILGGWASNNKYALLGAMSIGLNMALALVFMVPASVLGDEDQATVSQKIVWFVVGVLFQAVVMFGIIQYLLRRPTSGPYAG